MSGPGAARTNRLGTAITVGFAEEWAELKAQAENSQEQRVQLNSALPGAPSGEAPTLVVRQDDLGEVGHEAALLHRQLRRDADVTGDFDTGGRANSVRAAEELSNGSFDVGEALEKTNRFWRTKLRTVLQGCAHISNHLDYTASSHRAEDERIGATMRHRDGSEMSVADISAHLK